LYDIGANPQQPSAWSVNQSPCRLGGDDDLAVSSCEINIAVKPRAARHLTQPRPRGHAFAKRDIAAIINLMPRHDPDIGLILLRRGERQPVRSRNILNPAHPHRIIDMAEFVNVGGGGGDGEGVGGRHRVAI
jgi:hypothetical protein